MHLLSQIGFGHWTGFVGWFVSVATVLGLALVIRHERRQARSLVERSKELERLSSELLRVNRMKSEFLANVSHELRTPLNAIVGFVDLLREGQVKPVERIEASANHLRHLVDQVLDLAKMAAGRLEIHTETIDLRPFVLDVASEIESLVSEKGLHLSLVMGAALPRVRTDPTHLRQILVNFLGNAVKYTNEGGIIIRTRLVDSLPDAGPGSVDRSSYPTNPWIGVQVIDTGIGIDPADQSRIFEEFEQIDAGPRGNSAERGTGLGLAISRRLAALIGGMVELESEIGKGSTFTLWLPVDPDDLPVASK
jgi:signal transduction histidine kinase